MGSTVDGFISSAMAPAEPTASAALGKHPTPRDAYRDPARPSSGFCRPAATIRICDMRGNTIQIIEVPAIEAERPELEYRNEGETW